MQTLQHISSLRSSTTNLVTYILAAGQNLTLARKKLDTEIASAANVKDKATRQEVIAGMRSVQEQLSLLEQNASSNGVAIFAGQCL